MGKKTTSLFRDKRLDVVYSKLLDSMQTRHAVVLHQLGENIAEEAQYRRFIHNRKITPDRILSHYWRSSSLEMKDKHLLVVSDTSTLSFAKRADRERLGALGGSHKKEGYDIHPSIFLDAQNGGCYGLGGIDFFEDEHIETPEQKKAQLDRREQVWKMPLEDKESYKWISSPRKAIENNAGAARYTLVGDRESDSYTVIYRTEEQGHGYVYRSSQDRKLYQHPEGKKLYEQLQQWPVEDLYSVDVSATKERTAHTAQLALKFGHVRIQRPRSSRIKDLPLFIPMYVVQAREIPDSVIGEEKPVNWVLLTSHPVHTKQEAHQIIQWYCWRWTIEQAFRTAKTKGLDIESSEVKTAHGLRNLTTLALIAALQVMLLVQARQGNTDQVIQQAFLEHELPCLMALNRKLEGNTQKSKNPYHPKELAYATWIIARLGGWKGYQKKKPPGPITIINGLTRFYDILRGYYLII